MAAAAKQPWEGRVEVPQPPATTPTIPDASGSADGPRIAAGHAARGSGDDDDAGAEAGGEREDLQELDDADAAMAKALINGNGAQAARQRRRVRRQLPGRRRRGPGRSVTEVCPRHREGGLRRARHERRHARRRGRLVHNSAQCCTLPILWIARAHDTTRALPVVLRRAAVDTGEHEVDFSVHERDAHVSRG